MQYSTISNTNIEKTYVAPVPVTIITVSFLSAVAISAHSVIIK